MHFSFFLLSALYSLTCFNRSGFKKCKFLRYCCPQICLKLNETSRQFDTSPTQGWGKVGAKLGQGLGQGPGKVLGKVWTKSKVQARSGQARSGQGWGKVGARSGQKARFGRSGLPGVPRLCC